LHVLSGLRNLRPLFNKKIKTMPVLFDIDFKDDPYYLDGLEEGIGVGEKKKANLMVENLLLESELSIKSIAKIADETEAFVRSIQNRLIQEGKLLPND
jgi:hypothetical protein